MNNKILNEGKEFQKWGLVGTLVWGFIIALVFVVVELVTMVIYIIINYGDVAASDYEKLISDLQHNGTILSIGSFATLFVCGAMILGIVKIKKGSNLKDYLGLQSVDLKSVRYWVLILAAFIVLTDALSMLLDIPVVPEVMLSLYSSAESPWLLWTAIIIAAPIFEELFFRGFLFSGMKSSIIGPVGAILVTSFLWAAIHVQYDMYFMAVIFLMGLGLGVARLKTKSVLLTILLHSLANLVASIETIASIS